MLLFNRAARGGRGASGRAGAWERWRGPGRGGGGHRQGREAAPATCFGTLLPHARLLTLAPPPPPPPNTHTHTHTHTPHPRSGTGAPRARCPLCGTRATAAHAGRSPPFPRWRARRALPGWLVRERRAVRMQPCCCAAHRACGYIGGLQSSHIRPHAAHAALHAPPCGAGHD